MRHSPAAALKTGLYKGLFFQTLPAIAAHQLHHPGGTNLISMREICRKTHCRELIWVFEILLSGERIFTCFLNYEACSAQSGKCILFLFFCFCFDFENSFQSFPLKPLK